MSFSLDVNGLNRPQGEPFALDCPYCDVRAHFEPQAVPELQPILRTRPRHVGMVFQCAACEAPVFLKFGVKRFADDSIELYQNFVELKRRREQFSLSYLPQPIDTLYREALECYSDGHLNAFVSMTRRAVSQACREFGERGRMLAFDEIGAACELAGLDKRTGQLVRQALFDGPDENTLPVLNRAEAGVLLEVSKDLLYQLFIRKAKLQRALKVRRFFVAENADQADAG